MFVCVLSKSPKLSIYDPGGNVIAMKEELIVRKMLDADIAGKGIRGRPNLR